LLTSYAFIHLLFRDLELRQGHSLGLLLTIPLLSHDLRCVDFDALTEGQCLGAVPLSKDIGKTKLRFGMTGPASEKVRHAAFGLENSVQPLQKGIVCS
jgi:hypothetical protein